MKHTLMPWERAVHFRRGELIGELGPGEHTLGRRDQLHRVDTRPRSQTPAWQDVPTSDGVLIRVTLAVTWAVADATAFVVAAQDPTAELHLALQLALRAAILTRPHDQVDPARGEVSVEIQDIIRPRVAELGIELRQAAVRDVVMPAELRKAALAELVARSESRACLERARGETAALRSLLNAARLAEEHPALLQLRSLQAAQTVVVHTPH
ncbi:SPFH domain-containing protein [Actinosynnema sp. NPDC047251]|uniref:SPFH domain-containing protein n=1 Tax=Saccharothrix espanaensis TaxID=103731 RepID=UPI0002DEE433|nr:SPFH domain-containing protein [Saccharothrix espanaensis]